jgi:2-succinyl-6-hydroxy-2,4-cyclohexadiene-1-carboxylate synthase
VTRLLLLHGFTGAPGAWDAVRAALPAATVHVPWLVGHGVPEAAPEVHRFEAEVDRLAALLDGPFVVAGYSLGARLGLGLLVRHPQKVRAAVLISGSAGLDAEAARSERRAADARWIELLQTEGLEAFATRWQRQPLFASQASLPSELRDAEARRRRSHTAHGLARSLGATGLGVMPAYRADLPRIPQPVAWLVGENDPRFVELGRELVPALRSGRLCEVKGAAHNLLLERPDAVANEIARELAQ